MVKRSTNTRASDVHFYMARSLQISDELPLTSFNRNHLKQMIEMKMYNFIANYVYSF